MEVEVTRKYIVDLPDTAAGVDALYKELEAQGLVGPLEDGHPFGVLDTIIDALTRQADVGTETVYYLEAGESKSVGAGESDQTWTTSGR